MQILNQSWKVILGGIGALIIAQFFFLSPFFLLKKQKYKPKKQITLHVFIHGTFGSSLGLLSFFPVINDDFKGSHYVKTTRLMRKDPFFYKDQPMLNRGLFHINPDYTMPINDPFKKIAPALIKAYADINSLMKQNNVSQFYTFGWSGLLSRQRRRQEALRLYNALSEEITKYENQGFKTKIIIAAHSHGGNVALNLAGINQARSLLATKQKPAAELHEEALKMYHFLEECNPKKIHRAQGEKKFNYFPEGRILSIDRLYLLGTPIQPETDHYATDAKTFKRIYNFYSDNDPIQKMDWVSTSRYYSDQRFKYNEKPTHIIQIKLSYDLTKKTTEDKANQTWVSKIIPSLIAGPSHTLDPSHRDFWFIAHQQEQSNQSFLYPLPLFIFCPLMHTIIKKQTLNDLDINISPMHNHVRFVVSPHQDEKQLTTELLPLSFIKNIQNNILPWQPDHTCKKQEFDIIANHVKRAASLKE